MHNISIEYIQVTDLSISSLGETKATSTNNKCLWINRLLIRRFYIWHFNFDISIFF